MMDDNDWQAPVLGDDEQGPRLVTLPLTIAEMLKNAAEPQPLESTSLGLLLNDQEMADAGIGKGGSAPTSASQGVAQDRSGQTKPDMGDVAGKIWNAPNTAAGLGYGALGYLAGWPSYLLGLQDKPPSVTTGNNAVQFTHSPLMAPGAGITLGNAQVFNGEPSDRANPSSPSIGQHEEQHTYQGQGLGPLYLPSNILGGLAGELIDGSWHGPHNWNEVGPQQNPPVPWPK